MPVIVPILSNNCHRNQKQKQKQNQKKKQKERERELAREKLKLAREKQRGYVLYHYKGLLLDVDE